MVEYDGTNPCIFFCKIIDGMRVIGIYMDPESNVDAFVSKYRPTYPIFLPNDSRKFQQANKIGSVPKTIVRNGDGTVTLLYTSSLTKEDLLEMASAISTSTTIH
jgi:predicted RNase H-related nuclease YkuK (DUF458 family)